MKSHEASSQALLEGSTANKANASFHGAWLVAARSAWMLITLACLMIFFASIPAYLTVLHHVCTGSADIGSTCEINNQLSQANLLALAQSNISLDGYATLVVIIDSISSLTFILTGALIFRRKSNERFALFVSLILVLFGSLGPHLLNRSMLLIAQYPTWQVVLPVLLFQQTKWLIFGFVGTILLKIPSFTPVDPQTSSPLLLPFYVLISYLPWLPLPLSIGIALLRYRLWDIDTIINRTLVYGLLTLILGLGYLGLVFGGQALLTGLIGGNHGIVIVASTLIMALLLQPLRRGIQNVIDQRFYRQKYNAQRTLQTFSATLHQEIDLAHLSEQIVSVVQETLQPAQISLWLLPSGRKASPLPPAPLEAMMETGIDVKTDGNQAPKDSDPSAKCAPVSRGRQSASG